MRDSNTGTLKNLCVSLRHQLPPPRLSPLPIQLPSGRLCRFDLQSDDRMKLE